MISTSVLFLKLFSTVSSINPDESKRSKNAFKYRVELCMNSKSTLFLSHNRVATAYGDLTTVIARSSSSACKSRICASILALYAMISVKCF